MTSWYAQERTIYRKEGAAFFTLSEFQRLSCPHCGANLVGRLTHVWFDRLFPQPEQENYHYNLGATEDSVKAFPLFYTNPDSSEGMFAAGEALIRVNRAALPDEVGKDWPSLKIGEVRQYGKVEALALDL